MSAPLTPEQAALQNLVEARHAAERLDRLDELDSTGVMLLLAYLDGRAPGLVDEWFADREARKAATESGSVRG